MRQSDKNPRFGQWISTARKPKTEEPVLLSANGEVFQGFYTGTIGNVEGIWCEGTVDAYFEVRDVDAWMPMPKPVKRKETDEHVCK